MPMRYPGDREADVIGKLIDAGHAELAASTFRSRWRYRLLGRVLPALIPFVGAVVWHFAKTGS